MTASQPGPQPGAGEQALLVVIEVPKGCQNKYEYDPKLDRMVLNRVLYSPVYYPGEYGFVPDTLAEDGDPLDVLVMSTISTFPGCAVPVRVLGALDMHDDKGPDTKILAVVSVDPRLEQVRAFDQVPPHFLREVEHFFRVYKELEGKTCVIHGWRREPEAWQLIREARERAAAARKQVMQPLGPDGLAAPAAGGARPASTAP
ncbi:inorganic diphosphatase [Carboxydochorda subterranea]|uniref:Inorganic pyrophosphatase n=1 Tax=Carboxydichorda subterranea TaxID=3109565 RepID=A0ABZ1C000_9FIRM|nr:inorganic diphosphatase [Limnochorda sp. L945t]WRP17638.1 inorganic diphosphatase [Limnochorda sp. L945t]